MTIARSQIVNTAVTRYYHCISRCVRRAHLCGEGYEHRKDWLENRLEELSHIFAISVCSYSTMDSHFHLVLRMEDRAIAEKWTDREVAARWARLFPKRDRAKKPIPVTKEWIDEKVKDDKWIAQKRKNLTSMGWFMKCLKEPLARMANKEDEVTGHFWEARYKSIAILDNQALLATCTYVDLNPVAAGMANLPEKSNHTSLKARIAYCRKQGEQENLKQLLAQTIQGDRLDPQATGRLEKNVWLCPFADLSAQQAKTTPNRQGMLRGFSLPQYLHLVDWTSRLRREGKTKVSAQVGSMLQRMGTDSEMWTANLQQLFKKGDRLLGVAFSFSREKLRAAATQRGCHHLANLGGCKA